MASKGLYKRGNVWWIRYAGVDGRTRKETTRTTNHREALTLLIKRRQSVLEGKEPEVKRIKSYCFFELKEEYLKWAERQKRRNSSCYPATFALPIFPGGSDFSKSWPDLLPKAPLPVVLPRFVVVAPGLASCPGPTMLCTSAMPPS